MFLIDLFNGFHYPINRVMELFHDSKDNITPKIVYLIACFYVVLNDDNRSISGLTYKEVVGVYNRLMRKYGKTLYHDIESDKVYSVEYLEKEYSSIPELKRDYESFSDFLICSLYSENGTLEIMEV